MSFRAFRKALYGLPLTQEERDSLTADELFVLVVAHRLNGLSRQERRRMAPNDLRRLAAAGLLPAETARLRNGLLTAPRSFGL
jgi:hypothetical protein